MMLVTISAEASLLNSILSMPGVIPIGRSLRPVEGTVSDLMSTAYIDANLQFALPQPSHVHVHLTQSEYDSIWANIHASSTIAMNNPLTDNMVALQ